MHLLHISGKRMKATGVDGLSRGDHTKGMMAGDDPMSFLPFHLGADTHHKAELENVCRAGGGPATKPQDLGKTGTGGDCP